MVVVHFDVSRIGDAQEHPLGVLQNKIMRLEPEICLKNKLEHGALNPIDFIFFGAL
jgi:hypothetical protein